MHKREKGDNIAEVEIPKFEPEDQHKFFSPRFIKVLRGESIRWTNNDKVSHNLVSYRFDTETDLLKIGLIRPGHSVSKKIILETSTINYHCAIHPEEQGTIVILDKKEETMTNADRFRLLSDVFDIEPSPILRQLDSSARQSREQILSGSETHVGSLLKYFDPIIFEVLLNPELYRVQSKRLSIVFWDISGFSDLCNNLIDEPDSILSLLKRYFDNANEIIHENDGILDKFIGDGILAYFGYHDNQKIGGAIDAVNAALKLRKAFRDIKSEWTKEFDLLDAKVDLKCGINTGDVLFGLLETKFRNQITITGTNVNLASRLEGEAKNDEIIVSKGTMNKCKKKFVLESRIYDIKSYGLTEAFLVRGTKK